MYVAASPSPSLPATTRARPTEPLQTEPDRTQRLKGAREEASKEVDALKKKKDDEVLDVRAHSSVQLLMGRNVVLSSQHSNDSNDSQDRVNKSTTEQLEKIQSSFDSNKSTVVDQLLERVVQVKAEPHRNLAARS